SKVIYVDYCGAYCEAKFEHFFETGCKVVFNDHSTSSFIVSGWHWDFGDGHSSRAQNPEHSYQANGVYDVKLVITTDDNCTDSVIQRVEVTDCTPECHASFKYYVSNSLVYFNDKSLSQDPITDWRWEFGDGGHSLERHPVHHYRFPGVYPVTLNIHTVDGCHDQVKSYVTITGCGLDCKADFAYTSDEACVYQFEDYSQSNSVIIQWEWDFGTGETSSEPQPTYDFPADGDYTVQLVILTANECRDTIRHPITVRKCGTGQERFAPNTQSDLQGEEVEDTTTPLGKSVLKDQIELFPNPTEDAIRLDASFYQKQQMNWQIVDLRGKVVSEADYQQQRSFLKEQISLDGLSDGVYLFYLYSAEGLLYRSKIIKQ
ncbi:MAG: PKD domain-containing protein, partial [Bacteroidota bacterium]